MSGRARPASRRNDDLVIGSCLVLAVGIVGLVLAGLLDRRTTAFSVDVPAAAAVAMMAPGQRICQGPLAVVAPFNGVTAWMLLAKTSRAKFVVTARPDGGTAPTWRTQITPQSGIATNTPTALSGSFSSTIASGQRISLCLQSHSAGVIDVLGSTAVRGSGTLRLGGKPSQLALALVFKAPHPASVLALIPTIFSRAAVFRLPWFGAWTFWTLLAGVVVSVLLVLDSLPRAASLDDGSEPRDV